MLKYTLAILTLISTGCRTVDSIEIRVQDKATQAPLIGAQVVVTRRTLYFARPVPRPSVPAIQSGITTEAEPLIFLFVEGDSMSLEVSCDGYEWQEILYPSWESIPNEDVIEAQMIPE